MYITNTTENVKKLIEEFKAFAVKGNVLDMAVGVIIGGAFTSIVNSLVEDVFTPIIGMITGGINFSNLSFGILDAQIQIGNFLNAVISFLLTAFCVFLIVKAVNKLIKKKEAEPAPAPEPSAEEVLLTEIRDLLKNK